MEDYYKVLGIDKSASQADIKSAYRKLAKTYHPDKNKGDKASEEKFKKISEAYDNLSTPEKRKRYDMGGRAGGRPQGDSFSAWGEFFRQQNKPRRPNLNIGVRVMIPFMDLINGKTKIQFRRVKSCHDCGGAGGTNKTTCTDCGGSGSISQEHPLGVMTSFCQGCGGTGAKVSETCRTCSGGGNVAYLTTEDITIPLDITLKGHTEMIINGKGNGGIFNGEKMVGDLHIMLKLETDNGKFSRTPQGNLLTNLSVDFYNLLLGTEMVVEDVTGNNVKVTIPEGTVSGSTLRLKGKGLPKDEQGGKTDLLLKVSTVLPTSLTDEQRKIIEEFKNTMEVPTK